MAKDLKKEIYLNKSDIQKLFNLSYKRAKSLYDKANEIDEEELNQFRIEPNKVRTKTCLKIQRLSYNDLEKLVSQS